jgi:small-conductance mechanosensitive channel
VKIDWASLGTVAVVTVAVTLVVVGVVSIGISALVTAEGRTAAGHSGTAARIAGYLCVGVAGLILLYGLYLIIPQFH